jgi:hypothetical protein
VRFDVFTAVTIRVMFFWLRRHVDWLVEANVSEKLALMVLDVLLVKAVSIFSREVGEGIFRAEDGDSTLLRNAGFY